MLEPEPHVVGTVRADVCGVGEYCGHALVPVHVREDPLPPLHVIGQVHFESIAVDAQPFVDRRRILFHVNEGVKSLSDGEIVLEKYF